MQATQAPHDPLARTLRILSRRWTLEILEFVAAEPRRFSEIHHAFPGLSERVMWERLRDLIDGELLERIVAPGPPITSTYAATARARDVRVRIEDLRIALGVERPRRHAA
jgi:DNA-binding HxlR family transcriptional regulator